MSRLERARAGVGRVDRLLLELHGTRAGGGREEAAAAWELVGDELIDAALGRSPVHLPEAYWRFEGPEELRPIELPTGRTAIAGDVLRRRAAWLKAHAAELGL